MDAFTASAFGGNPAAVMLLEDDIQDEMKQKIAREMNISETAFVTKLNADDDFENSDRYILKYHPFLKNLYTMFLKVCLLVCDKIKISNV